METSSLLRHQWISSLLARQTDPVADSAVRWWNLMASQVISIVGEEGFNSLYDRSVFLTRPGHPWLAADAPAPPAGSRFAQLKMNLQEQPPAQADAANTRLLITFTDILASLIGEPLTARILRTAWSHEVKDRSCKELNHES